MEKQAEKLECSFYDALRRGSYKTQQDLAVLDFRKQIQEINESPAKRQPCASMAARLSGYDEYVLAEDGEMEDEGEGSSRLDNLDELITLPRPVFIAPEGMLTFVAGQIRKAQQSVALTGRRQYLMTIHRSKGLGMVRRFCGRLRPKSAPPLPKSLRYVDGVLLT